VNTPAGVTGEIHLQKHYSVLSHESPTEFERIFFPYEIQIIDKESYQESVLGESAHTHYKQRQLFMARRRLLSTLLVPSV
jgi:uncharacterized protein (TIGR04562 family)